MADFPVVDYEYVMSHYEGRAEDLGSQQFIETKIALALARLESRYGRRIAERLRSGALSEELFKATVADAVLRIARNPDGFTTEQQGNYSYGVRAVVASGYLWFTPENMIDLLGEPPAVVGTYTIGDHWRS